MADKKFEAHIVIKEEEGIYNKIAGYNIYSENEGEKHLLRMFLIGELQVMINELLEDDKPFRENYERLV